MKKTIHSGTKALSDFTHIECGQVFQSLHMHRKTLRYMDKLLFDITFIKLARQRDLEVCRSLEFDGMEMRTMSEALRFRCRLFLERNNFVSAITYVVLAEVIEGEMFRFQQGNKPEIEKHQLLKQ